MEPIAHTGRDDVSVGHNTPVELAAFIKQDRAATERVA
jgi:hypothetical protein